MNRALLLTLLIAGCSTSTLHVQEVEPGLWRSNQPTTRLDWIKIKAMGVKTVVKLNMPEESSDDQATELGLHVFELGIEPRGDLMSITRLPDEHKLNLAEAMISMGGGVLVHCTHGQDRTGLIIGRHRVLADGWTKARAYREMLEYGFHPALVGLQTSWIAFRSP
jgi:protein tyrosine/serine phosphatase